MLRKVWLVVALVIFLISTIHAGGDHYKCKLSTQECLDQMVTKLKEHGWVGIELEKDDVTGALTVRRVIPDSPAEKAGFQTGDVLVALNGIRFGKEQEEALGKVKETMKPGKEVTYSVSRNSYERQITVTLGTAPSDVLATWIGHHMLEHSSMEIAKK